MIVVASWAFFCVRKGKKRIRLTQDCRRANRQLREPPGVAMLSGEGLAKIEVLPGCESFDFDLITADVSDCFHRMRLRGSIRKYFCWPSISCSLVGVSEVAAAN